MKWSRTCDFFDVCCGEALLSDTTRFRRLEKPNPELKETIPGDRLDLPLLTTSRLSTARTCQRLHRFRYLDRYRPVVEAEPLIFGQLIHEALEAWWTAPVDRLAAALAAIRKETP